MGKRFQAKKLNKDDHKGVKDTAGAVKKVLAHLALLPLLSRLSKNTEKTLSALPRILYLESNRQEKGIHYG